jgi:hypothetical protein
VTGWFRRLWAGFWRVRWMIGILFGVLLLRQLGLVSDASPVVVILHKLALGGLGFAAAFLALEHAFPYLHQRALLELALSGDGDAAFRAAILFLGVAILRGLVYAAFVLGVTLGL